jgi:hypothetical protein
MMDVAPMTPKPPDVEAAIRYVEAAIQEVDAILKKGPVAHDVWPPLRGAQVDLLSVHNKLEVIFDIAKRRMGG